MHGNAKIAHPLCRNCIVIEGNFTREGVEATAGQVTSQLSGEERGMKKNKQSTSKGLYRDRNLLVIREGRIAGEVDPTSATSADVGLLMTAG